MTEPREMPQLMLAGYPEGPGARTGERTSAELTSPSQVLAAGDDGSPGIVREAPERAAGISCQRRQSDDGVHPLACPLLDEGYQAAG